MGCHRHCTEHNGSVLLESDGVPSQEPCARMHLLHRLLRVLLVLHPQPLQRDRKEITMADRIEIQNVRKEGQPNAKGKRSVYYVEEVRCPMTEESQPSNRCKQCQHCRIYLGTHVKCTYADDKRRKEQKSVTGY